MATQNPPPAPPAPPAPNPLPASRGKEAPDMAGKDRAYEQLRDDLRTGRLKKEKQ